MPLDLLSRKQTHFVLWRPRDLSPTPTLYIGIPTPGANPYANFREIPLHPSTQFPELWEVAAQNCGLTSGQVYFYWFRLNSTNPYSGTSQVVYCTDPIAYTVDRRYPAPPSSGVSPTYEPASVIFYRDRQLVPCDPEGQTVDWSDDPSPSSLPANNCLVIYELPTRWTRTGADAEPDEETLDVGTGTFRDVMALVQPEATAPDFLQIAALQAGRAHLVELGINALELLPPADNADRGSDDKYKWGYGTANYFAADYDLGKVDGNPAPTASTDLATLIKRCHQNGMRFFLDAVMAFSSDNPYHDANFLDFYIQWRPKGDPARDPEQGDRDSFGGDLFKYNYWVEGYHPITGSKTWLVPAREYMKLYAAHWITYYRVDGLRLDSVNNVGNYDFLQEYKELSRQLWLERGGDPARFLVVGEELSVPLALLHQKRLDSLWNERFKQILRQVILGKPAMGDNFEGSVRKLIDVRLLGFRDGSQAVNYITSHDVGGFGNERIYNYLNNNGVHDTEKRIKLAFVCLLTAVGIPMILAGDEFADQHDLNIDNEHGDAKQLDPVNYNRMNDDWRRRIFDYVARLIKFRTQSNALAVNDTVFLHVDFTQGKRVFAWQRGYGANLVVVVANFSDYGTPNVDRGGEYIVPNFPPTPQGKRWREITQNRIIPKEWVGREPVFPWEAKVYALEG